MRFQFFLLQTTRNQNPRQLNISGIGIIRNHPHIEQFSPRTPLPTSPIKIERKSRKEKKYHNGRESVAGPRAVALFYAKSLRAPLKRSRVAEGAPKKKFKMFEEGVVDPPSPSPSLRASLLVAKGATAGRGCVLLCGFFGNACYVRATHVRVSPLCVYMCVCVCREGRRRGEPHALTHALEGLRARVSPAQERLGARGRRRCCGRSDRRQPVIEG